MKLGFGGCWVPLATEVCAKGTFAPRYMTILVHIDKYIHGIEIKIQIFWSDCQKLCAYKVLGCDYWVATDIVDSTISHSTVSKIGKLKHTHDAIVLGIKT